MIMINKNLITSCTILPLLLLILSCNNLKSDEEALKVLKIDADPIECNSIFDVVEKMKIIPLESNDNALISDLFKILYNDGKFYLLDPFTGKSVLIYYADGSHLKTISALGKGPAEFTQPWDLAIDPFYNELFITDVNTRKVLRYDLDGNFKDEMHTDFIPLSIGFIDSESFVFRTQSDVARIVTTNRDGENEKIIHENFFSALMPNFYNFQKNAEDLLYYEVFNDTIYALGRDSAKPFLRVDFLDNRGQSLSKEEINSTQNPDRIRISRFMETKEHYCLFFRQERRRAYFYNKKTGEGYLLEDRGKSKNSFCELLFKTMGHIPEEGYYSQLSAIDFLEMKEQPGFTELLKQGKIEIESNAFSGQETITEDSNPVLIIMEFKY